MIGLAALVSLTACDNPVYPGAESNEQAGNGEGSVSFAKLALNVSNAEIVIDSRAGVDVGTFTINILKSNGEVAQSYIYSRMPELIALPVGTYTVEAYNAEEQVAAFDAPYFYGKSNSFTVTANNVTEVDPITCKLSNVKVSIAYTDELRSRMSDVKVTVTVAENEVLEFAGDETRSGYFKYVPGNTTIAATFEGKVDGFQVSDYKVLTNAVAPGYHHTITFDLKDTPNPPDESGSIGTTGLSLDATVTRVDLAGDVILNGGEEETIEPDPAKEYLTLASSELTFGCDAESKTVAVKASHDWSAASNSSWCKVTKTDSGLTVSVDANSDASNDRTATITVTMNKLTSTITVTQAKYTEKPQGPTFESEYIDLWSGAYNDPTEFGAGKKPAVVNISAPRGIKKLHVTISSATLSPMLPGVGLATQFDLATGLSDDGSDLTDALVGLGFPVGNGGSTVINGETINYNAVMDQTSVVFDITSFMDLMVIPGPGKSDFIVEVTDSDGNVAEATIRYEVK